jgi:hypothetical protein
MHPAIQPRHIISRRAQRKAARRRNARYCWIDHAASPRASWFATRGFAAFLTKGIKTSSLGALLLRGVSKESLAVAISRHDLPEVYRNILPPGGSRECRGRAAPAVSCAICAKKCAHEHTGSAEALRHSLRNGFTAYGALSPATNSFCHRRCRLEAETIRLDRLHHRQLDTSNGCRNHTLLPYAATRLRQQAQPGQAPFVLRAVHRSRKTALRPPCAPTPPRPPHPNPRS